MLPPNRKYSPSIFNFEGSVTPDEVKELLIDLDVKIVQTSTLPIHRRGAFSITSFLPFAPISNCVSTGSTARFATLRLYHK